MIGPFFIFCLSTGGYLIFPGMPYLSEFRDEIPLLGGKYLIPRIFMAFNYEVN